MAVLILALSALGLPARAQAQTITVSPPGLSSASPGVSYTQTFTASGQPGPYTFTVSAGALPPGLTLGPGGVLSGTTPLAEGPYDFTVRATAPSGGFGSRPYRLTIRTPVITLSPSSLPSVNGQPYSQSFSASGGRAPYVYSVDAGTLPPGLTLSSNRLEGTATTAGVYNFTIRAADADGFSTTRAYTVEVNSLAIGAQYSPSAQVYVAYSANFLAQTPVYTVSLDSGTLPPGLTLAPSGSLTGTPTTPGSYTFVIRVTDPNGLTGTGSYTITVSAPTIMVSPSFLPQAVPGVPFSQQISANGAPGPFTFTVSSGTPPAGIALSTTGLLSGVANTPGLYPFTVRATDPNGFTGEVSYFLDVTSPVITMTPTLPAGRVSSVYGETIVAAGGLTSPYSYAVVAGALPAGLSLSSGGEVSGTPTAAGTFNFTVQATDSSGYQGVQAYSLVIGPQIISISPAALPAGTVGSVYSQALTASGGTGPYSFAPTAVLPAGISLSGGGVLSGTPQNPGTYNFTVLATDANGVTTNQAFSLTVQPQTVITMAPATLAVGTAGAAYAQTLSASGGTGPYSYALASGSLPNGITLSAAGSLSGAPTVTGSFPLTVRATDANGFSGVQGYTLQINAPTIVQAAPNAFTVTAREPFSQTLSASGGSAPYSYVVVAGSLPAGASLSGAGVLSGTPTATGNFAFTVRATDAGGFHGDQAYSLGVVSPVIVPGPASLPAGQAGVPYSTTLSATGGAGPYTFAASTALPPDMTLSSAGVLTGTPTRSGTYSFLVVVTDANGFTGSRNYEVVLGAAGALALTPATLPAGAGGVAYSQTFTASGGVGPYTFSQSGTLPRGITFNAATGVLAGTPLDTGSFTFFVQVEDRIAGRVSRSYALQIAAVSITTSPSAWPAGVSGQPYSLQLGATGGTAPYQFIQLPAPTDPQGLSISASGLVSGTVSTPGDYTVYYDVTDSLGFRAGSRSATLSIVAPVITVTAPATGALPGVAAGAAYSQTFTASGGTGPHSFALASGALPAGLTLSSAGVLSGTPTAAGSFSFSVRATDSSPGPGGPFSSAATAYTLVVNAPTLALSPTTLAQGRNGQAFSQSFTASGGVGPYAYDIVGGALPTGLTLSAAGVLSGTPTVAGAFNVTVRATDANGFSISAPYALIINPSVVVGPPVTVEILAGQAVTVDLTAGAAGGPFTDATLVGLSPASAGSAVISSPATGQYALTFTPSAAFSGTVTVTYTLSNAGGVSAPGTVTVIVEARPDPAADAEVAGLIRAQGETARRFATSQIDNIGGRMEVLLNGGGSGGPSLRLGFTGGSQPFDYGLDPALRRMGGPVDEPPHGLPDRIAADGAPGAAGLTDIPDSGHASRGPLGVWAAGVVDFGRHDGRSGQEGAKFTTSGLTAGVDYRLDDRTWLGVGLGYGRDATRIGDDGSRSESSAYSAAVYGGVRPSPASFVNGVLGYGMLDYEATRYITATGDLAMGKRDGDQWFSAVTGGWDLTRGEWRLSPYGRLALSRSALGAWAETTGGPYALAYDEQVVITTTGSLGLRSYRDWLTDDGLLTSRFRLEYSHDFGRADDGGLSYADWIGGPTYRLGSADYGRDWLRLGAGLELLRQRGARLGLDYEIQLGRDLTQHQFGVQVRTPF